MRLSVPIYEIKQKYDVVVIGSGYGGSVAAARFAEAGKNVCILEKGKEFIPGDFPTDFSEISKEIQVNTLSSNWKNKTALFDYKIFDGLHVLCGSGLGGGSLINAGVAERPSREVLNDIGWPDLIRRDIDSGLEEAFNKAERYLGSYNFTAGSKDFPEFRKYKIIKNTAEKLNKNFKNANLTINFKDSGKNLFGAYQEPCIGCGNCSTGCNYNSKNSLDKNYLFIARKNGAEIFTKSYVSHFKINPDDSYLIFFNRLILDMKK